MQALGIIIGLGVAVFILWFGEAIFREIDRREEEQKLIKRTERKLALLSSIDVNNRITPIYADNSKVNISSKSDKNRNDYEAA